MGAAAWVRKDGAVFQARHDLSEGLRVCDTQPATGGPRWAVLPPI